MTVRLILKEEVFRGLWASVCENLMKSSLSCDSKFGCMAIMSLFRGTSAARSIESFVCCPFTAGLCTVVGLQSTNGSRGTGTAIRISFSFLQIQLLLHCLNHCLWE